MNARTARTSIAALLASTLLLAGCSDGDKGADNDKAGDGTSSDAGSPSPSDAGTGDGSQDGDQGGGTSGSLDKDTFYETITKAQQDAGSYRSTATTSAGGVDAVMDGEASYVDGALVARAKSQPGNPQQVESVIADGILYLKSDGMGVPAGKWLKLDPEDPANAGGPFAGLAAAADPEAALRAVGSLKELELVGSEKVGDVDADHYRAVMSTANYAKELGIPAEVADILPPQLPFDMWVDSENRPVKFTLTFEIEGVSSSTEQTYFDYGADIDIEVPADRDTVTPTEAGLAS
ncbi:hypothetical protein ASE01_10215 [Nocardioides sp. Root190]|uniref:hypothetical protein n=1 Tax=Nocardioides sp. Root190 TaxID=1736488 RepID=UPI0006F1E5DB|nr:hypothetical protein [Nocardioides sp. Root190]KRB77116.1 hypothetical protein ASE01_10215 [Nocardioides sp. Root190]